MIQKLKNKLIKSNNGEIMLEALIVYTVTIFLLFFILALFSVLFQRWNIHTIANEAVTRVAQTYRYANADVSTGEITEDDLANVDLYRNGYLFDIKGEISKGVHQQTIKEKLIEYASERLRRTTFTKEVGTTNIIPDIRYDSLGRYHLSLTISGKYKVPFGESMAFFGFPGVIEYEVTSYAECFDMLEYINTIDYVDVTTSLKSLNSDIVKFINSILKMVNG
ncbi:MAG: hypothetical protein E7404_04595 [Ruminococcaceae bacterium]|nr:hypothetical protein [Oscillospiraceae bacterium]